MHQVFTTQPANNWPRNILLILLALFGIAMVARIIPSTRTVDDAFITFRYSRNVVQGEGFVYNAGNRVLGTTTPLYALTMAGFGATLGHDNYPSYALSVNTFADALSVVLIFMLGAKLSGNRMVGLVAGGVWAIAPFSVTFAIGGMETSVHNLWMLSAWTAYLYEWRRGWVGAFVAFGILTRPDAAIWAVPLMLHQLIEAFRQRGDAPLTKWFPWWEYAVGLIIGLPWTIFATVYFGSPIPHTVGTKAAVYHVDGLQAILRLMQHYATVFHQHELLGAMAGVLLGLFTLPAFALIGARYALQRTPRGLTIMLYPWLYFAVFAGLNPLIFRWYLTPPLPAYYLAIVIGVFALLHEVVKVERTRNIIATTLGVFVFASLLSAWELQPDHGPERPAPRMAFHELELNYRQMAENLLADYDINDETLVAIGDIGSFGFYSNARILDTVGLVTEDLNDYYANEQQSEIIEDGANYAIPPQMIIDFEPAFIVVMADFVTLGLLQDPRFEELYDPEPIYTIPTEYYGDAMWVFARRDVR